MFEDQPAGTLDAIVTANYAVVSAACCGVGDAGLPDLAPADARDIEALVHVEKCIYSYTVNDATQVKENMRQAAAVSKVSFELSGMLALTTRWQTEKKAQLIVRQSSARGANATVAQLFAAAAGHESGCSVTLTDADPGLPAEVAIDDDKLLPEPRFEDPDGPGPPGCLSALSVFLCKSVFYGAFVWARMALKHRKRRFPARAVLQKQASIIDQCVILAGGMAADLGVAVDDSLREEELRAYARWGCSQPRSLWCLRVTSLWLRSRIETIRHRPRRPGAVKRH